MHVVSDRIAELGAEDGETFLTLEQLQLPGESDVGECGAAREAPP